MTYCLNLIADEKHVVFLAKCRNALLVPLGGNNDTVKSLSSRRKKGKTNQNTPSFALDGLNQKCRDILPVDPQRPLEILQHPISDDLGIAFLILEYRSDTFKVRPEASAALRICAHTREIAKKLTDKQDNRAHAPNYAQCSPMEISLDAEDNRLSFLDTLAHVCPFPCKLDRGLNSLCTSIHWQYHVIPKGRRNLLSKFAEYRVIEGTGGEREALSLCHKSSDDARVAMALINGTARKVMNL